MRQLLLSPPLGRYYGIFIFFKTIDFNKYVNCKYIESFSNADKCTWESHYILVQPLACRFKRMLRSQSILQTFLIFLLVPTTMLYIVKSDLTDFFLKRHADPFLICSHSHCELHPCIFSDQTCFRIFQAMRTFKNTKKKLSRILRNVATTTIGS